MEERLDEVARGERAWVPLLRDFYEPLKALVDEKRRELKRADFTTEATDEVCSLGHPMVIRLGRNGRFLACSLYPEHKESRPLPGRGGAANGRRGRAMSRVRTGRSGSATWPVRPFLSCSRYPDCGYIKRTGPPPPEQLPFEVVCPRTATAIWSPVARAGPATSSSVARRTPPATTQPTTCRWVPSMKPTGPIALRGDVWLCLKCGAAIPIPDAADPVGRRFAGGAPDPAALQRPRAARGGGKGKKSPSPRRSGARKPAARRSTRARAAGSA